MKAFKWLGLLAAPLLLLAASNSLQFQSQSSVAVAGTSSAHDWACESGQVVGTLAGDPAAGTITGVNVTIPVQALDCKNGTMNGKMRDALKAAGNPHIRFTLSHADVASPNGQGAFSVAATGQLSIAGATRPIRMDVRGNALSDGGYRFTGSVPLKMTDFGVSPPTAMFGALKTGDAVTVSFDVVAR